MDVFYEGKPYKSIYERMLAAGHTCKLFYYDEASSTVEVVNLLQNEPAIFGTFKDFLNACSSNALPDYCFIEPNYTDHDSPDGDGEVAACDQHPDHDVRAGEQFIATVYNAVRNNASCGRQRPCWLSTMSMAASTIMCRRRPARRIHLCCAASCDRYAGCLCFRSPRSARTGHPHIAWVEKGSVINDVYDHASIPRP